MALTTVQVVQLASAAGFPREDLITAAGIAWRESRNNPGAVGDVNNPKPGCRSLGLMQINVCPSYNNAGIWFRQQSETDPNHVLLNPYENMRAAVELRRQSGWRPWSTYRAGIPAPDTARIQSDIAAAGGLDQVLAGAAATAQAAGAGSLAGTLGSSSSMSLPSIGNPLDGFRFFAMLTDPATWVRVGLVLGGAVLAALGFYAVARDQGWLPQAKLAAGALTPSQAADAANQAPTPEPVKGPTP